MIEPHGPHIGRWGVQNLFSKILSDNLINCTFGNSLDHGLWFRGGGAIVPLKYFLGCLKQFQQFFQDGFWHPADPIQPGGMSDGSNFN